MTLAQATEAFQSLMEGHRCLTHSTDDHGLLEDVTAELARARQVMEIAWLKHTTT